MDKKYKIEWAEVSKNGSTNGRAWQIMKMSLTDEDGVKTEGVSTFETVSPGMELEGKIVTNDKGYLNFVKKLEAPQFIKQASNSAYKAQQIEKTMERKEGSISKFQDNKEWSIKVASTLGKAVDLAIVEFKEGGYLPDLVIKWRKFLWNNWDVNLEDTDAITGDLL